MKKIILLALLFSFSASTLVIAQTKTSQEEMFAATYHSSKIAVNSQHYQFVANVIHNSQEREILDGAINEIRINKLDVEGQLHGFSKDKVVNTLKDSNSKIETEFNDDNQEITITIETKVYAINIVVKPNGNAFLTLTGNGSSKLLYTGKLVQR
ncbi:DUF4251 domain-containing protein [Winogradskyella psychrotolerans]|uniref:DUF4251 domain-containing protein n=1 Tax=Winogradskyella psychrotolerans TaxID=1344585 RepID=UPI001C07E10A|nr:DUF4251 domain-containing protein [Winogradskyella psychrotolerans]MBU2929038.1 DUF4251 domain-containing protein [Winogradskyella psychrotolerans]